MEVDDSPILRHLYRNFRHFLDRAKFHLDRDNGHPPLELELVSPFPLAFLPSGML